MRIERGRPVITVEDYPEVIAEALRESIPLVNRGEIETQDVHLWRHNAQNNYEGLEQVSTNPKDMFYDPKASVTMWGMNADSLEVALVGWGIQPERTDEEVVRVNELLLSIDAIKAHQK